MNNSTFKTSRIVIISLSIFLLLHGCSPFKPVLYESTFNTIDLSKYNRSGLFITTGDFYQEYEPLSILTVNCFDGFYKIGAGQSIAQEKNNNKDDIYSDLSVRIKDYDFKSCYIDDLLDFIFEAAKDIEANGIIGLEIKAVSRSSSNGQTQNGLMITGLAIKY